MGLFKSKGWLVSSVQMVWHWKLVYDSIWPAFLKMNLVEPGMSRYWNTRVETVIIHTLTITLGEPNLIIEYNTETKQQSMHWKSISSLQKKKAWMCKSKFKTKNGSWILCQFNTPAHNSLSDKMFLSKHKHPHYSPDVFWTLHWKKLCLRL